MHPDTQFQNVIVGDVVVGSKGVLYNNTYFEVLSHNPALNKTELRCCEQNIKQGYGENVLIILDSNNSVMFDSEYSKIK